MISLVTSFKKFKGAFDTIQKSAIYSWGDLPIYAPVSEVDTLKICSSYQNIKLLSDIRRGTDLGFNLQVPVFTDLMKRVLIQANTTMIGILSSDIILPEDFYTVMAKSFDKYGFDVVITGTRHNIKLSYEVKDSESLNRVFQEKKSLDDPNRSDFFLTSKYLWRKILSRMPEFLFGRPYLNDFLYLNTILEKVKKYNCTNSISMLHPVHSADYVKILEGVIPSSTAEYNRKLFDKKKMSFDYSIRYWPIL